MRRLVTGSAAALAACCLLTGCTDGQGPADELQVSANLVAATPAKSPAQTSTPAGRVLPTSGRASTSAVLPGTRTLAVAMPSRLALYDLDALNGKPRTVALPGTVRHLSSTPSGKLLAPVPDAHAVFTVDPVTGDKRRTPVRGAPSSAAMLGDKLLVALPGRKTLAVLRDGRQVGAITGEVSPEQVLVTGGRAVVLDRLRSAVFDVRVDEQSFGPGLRADQGAVNAVTDSFDRVLVSEARVGQFFAFSTGPMLMRQRYPVPGVPYGITFDSKRNLVWMTLTKRNEVVGYDVAGGEPVERKRFATVRQPDSVTVDPQSGRVLIASANRAELQVIDS